MAKKRYQLIYRGEIVRTIYTISGAFFIITVPITLIMVIVFGSLPDAPFPANYITLVAVAIMVLSTLVVCITIVVEVIARALGKSATFGIATKGSRYIGDLSSEAKQAKYLKAKRSKDSR